MHPTHAYRLLALSGAVGWPVGVLFAVEALDLGAAVTARLPLVSPLPAASLAAGRLSVPLAVAGGVALVASLPLCKPRPRRILDTVAGALRSVLLVGAVLAALGYFDYTYRLPRATVLLSVAVLAVALPAWFVWLQERRLGRTGGVLVVGTDPRRIDDAIEAAADPVVGYAFSPAGAPPGDERVGTDGGAVPAALGEHDRLGGLSRLDGILRRSDVGTVVPALPRTDRAEFFGVLNACHRHGVDVAILDEHDDSVLVADDRAVAGRSPRLTRIDLEPFDPQTRACKRLFDVAFAVVGLVCALPLLVLIATAVMLDSRGPILYAQERTTQFGETFTVYKFRSMVPESESAAPGTDDERVTRVGRLLRETHLDELPQLWAILRGRMSVVGPRPAWTAEERLLRERLGTWQKRWFVKPGLTGLAQVHDRSSRRSAEKLRYDLAYIRRQSFAFDLKIVVRQLWIVAVDAVGLVSRTVRGSDGEQPRADERDQSEPDTDERERQPVDQP